MVLSSSINFSGEILIFVMAGVKPKFLHAFLRWNWLHRIFLFCDLYLLPRAKETISY